MKKLNVQKKGTGKLEMIYPAPLGKVLVYCDDMLLLYDVSARKVIQELCLSEVKHIYWN
jgi:hypothetical protein